MCCFDLLERDDSQCVVDCVVVQGQFALSFVPICKEVHYSPTISLALLLDWVALWSKEVRKRHQHAYYRRHGLVMNHLPIVNEYRKETIWLLDAMPFCPGADIHPTFKTMIEPTQR
jgi:hypothetical protein